jgi:excisionase family DNA binding protein
MAGMKTKDTPNRRTMNLEELATSLGIGRSLVYDLARRGELPVPVLKLGRRFVVPRSAVERLLGVEDAASASSLPPGQIVG